MQNGNIAAKVVFDWCFICVDVCVCEGLNAGVCLKANVQFWQQRD